MLGVSTKKFLVFLMLGAFFVLHDFVLYADGGLEGETPDPIGNFSLPISQQPACLFGFGQRIVQKRDLIVEVYSTYLNGIKRELFLVDPIVLYGIRDDLSFLVNIPVFVKDKDNGTHSSGMSDIFPVIEYAWYAKSTKTYYRQATIVTGVTLATGSELKNPPTGFGASAFFLGFTGSFLSERFYYYASVGTNQTMTSNNCNKFGSSYIYQFGGFVNLGDWKPGWIFNLGLEFNGIFSERDRLAGITNPNSGGNVIYFGPSFFAANERFVFQLGLQGVVSEHLFGTQNRDSFILGLDFEWKLNA